jgi:hypothetical protein
MISQIKRIALYSMAIAAGAAAFVFVWTAQASAAVTCPVASICYGGRTYNNLPVPLCQAYLLNGGLPYACGSVSQN